MKNNSISKQIDLNIVALTCTTSSQNELSSEPKSQQQETRQFSSTELEVHSPTIDDNSISNMFVTHSNHHVSPTNIIDKQDKNKEQIEEFERKTTSSTNTSNLLNLILANNQTLQNEHVNNSIIANNQSQTSINTSSFLQHLLEQQFIQNNSHQSFELYNTIANHQPKSSTCCINSITTDLDTVLLGQNSSTEEIINTNILFNNKHVTLPSTNLNVNPQQIYKTKSSTPPLSLPIGNKRQIGNSGVVLVPDQQQEENPCLLESAKQEIIIDLAVNNNKAGGNNTTPSTTRISSQSSLLSLMAGDGSAIVNSIVLGNNNNNHNNNTNNQMMNNNNSMIPPSETSNYIMNSLNSFNNNTSSNNNPHQTPLHHNNSSSQQSMMSNNNYNNGNMQNLPQHNTSSPPLIPNTHHHVLSSNPFSSQTNKASNMMMVGSSPSSKQQQVQSTTITSSSSPPLLYNNNNLYPQQYSATSLMGNNSMINNNTTSTQYGMKQNNTNNIGTLNSMIKADNHTTPSPSNHSSSTNFNYNNQQYQNNNSMIDNAYNQQSNNFMYNNNQQPITASAQQNNVVPNASPNLSLDHQQGTIQFQFHQHTPNQKKRGRQSNSNTPQTYQFQYYNGNTFTNTTNNTNIGASQQVNNSQSTFSQQQSNSYPTVNNQQQHQQTVLNNFTSTQQNYSNSNSSSGNTPLMYNNNTNSNNYGISREPEPFSSIETFNEEEEEDEDEEDENEEDDCEYHPIACVQCRQLHKKCDKKLPACTKCVSRGVECTYRTPKRNTSQPLPKKKKKKKKNGKTLQPSQTVNALVKAKVLDLYFTYLCPDFPLIDRSEMEFYLSDTCPVGTPNKKEVEVLFMAIRALCEYRVGSVENGIKAVQEARQALSTVFTDYSNFYVACSYCYMSYVESMNHDIKTANFFLKLVEYHLQDIPTDQLDEKQQILKRYHAFAKTSVSNRLLNDFTGNVMDVIKQIPQLYSLSTGQSLPPEFHNIVNQEITSTNYQEMLDVVETLFKLLHVQTDNLSKPVDIKDLRRIDLVYILMTNGLKIAILTKAGERKDLIEEAALKITYTTYSQLYAFSSVDMMGYVALGARVHYHIVRAIEAGQRSNFTNGIISLDGKIGSIDYYEILNNDLRAINLLKRYLRTPSPYFENLCSDIQTLLQNRGRAVQSSPPTLNTEIPNQPIYLDSTIQN